MDSTRCEHADVASLLAATGVDEFRRVASRTPERILLSKFEPGFFDALRNNLMSCPALFDATSVIDIYAGLAVADGQLSRVATWHKAMLELLKGEAERTGLTAAESAEITAGIDSVAAVLDAALWTTPLANTSDYEPANGERAAFVDALNRFETGHDLFARDYGDVAGARVVNHCPGVAVARRWLVLGWNVCTGTDAPT